MCHCHHQSGSCGCQSKGSSCGCQSSHCGCQQSSCGCGSNQSKGCSCGCKHCGCDYATKFLELADHAWMELLKEKIKEHIQTHSAQHLDELASLISEANHERWKKKIENRNCCGSYEDKLKCFFDQSCHNKDHK